MHQFIKSVGIALSNIRANPLHTFLSTLGIIIGVASLVAILALGDGLEQTGRKQLANTTSLNILNVSSNSYKTVDDIRIPVKNRPRLTVNNARDLEELFNERAVVEIVQRETSEVTFEDSSYAVYLQGSMENALSFVTDTISYGRFLTTSDISQVRKHAIINEALAQKWSQDIEQVIGDSFSMFDKEFTIVGVMNESNNDVPRILIPISVLQEIKEGFPTITLKVNKAEEIPVVEGEIKAWLDDKFSVGNAGFSLISNKYRVEQFAQGILLFKLIMGAITGISVLVGGIGVMNVLLISVTERTREIGIRKSTGAKKKDIILQFMAESITISIVGSVLGWVIGIIGIFIFVPIVNSMVEAQFVAAISTNTVFVILMISVFVGLIFGTYPAWRAAQLSPIDAMRHE